MKTISLLILCLFSYSFSFGQNIIIQQNNQPVQKEVVVKEKVVPVYIKEKPQQPIQPICLHGYLYVYPEDLGEFNKEPVEIINAINKSKAYGRSTWRIPTNEELSIMENNRSRLGMKSMSGGRYYVCRWEDGTVTFNWAAQCIRLVSTN